MTHQKPLGVVSKKANDRIAQGTKQTDYYQQWVMDKGLKSLAGN